MIDWGKTFFVAGGWRLYALGFFHQTKLGIVNVMTTMNLCSASDVRRAHSVSVQYSSCWCYCLSSPFRYDRAYGVSYASSTILAECSSCFSNISDRCAPKIAANVPNKTHWTKQKNAMIVSVKTGSWSFFWSFRYPRYLHHKSEIY